MASTAIVSRGSTLSVSDGASPEVYTALKNITTVPGPQSSAAEIEVTDLDSTAKEFLLDLADHGTITCQGFFNPNDTAHAQLQSDNVAGTARNYRITLSSSPLATYTFSARVSEWSFEAVTAGAISLTFGLRITGAVTVA
jgi:hypothetical protein